MLFSPALVLPVAVVLFPSDLLDLLDLAVSSSLCDFFTEEERVFRRWDDDDLPFFSRDSVAAVAADVAWHLPVEGSFVSWRGRDCDLVRDLSLDRDVLFSPSAAESVVRDRDLLRASPPPPRWSDLESPARVRLLLPADLTAVESSAIFLDRLRLLDDR